MLHEIGECRGCRGGDLDEVLDLGEISLNGFVAPEAPSPPKEPIRLVRCARCALVQQGHFSDPDQHFRDFWYLSGTTATMRAALLDVVEVCRVRAAVTAGDTVVDIGSNDSTLLGYWGEGIERIGFEPARNLIDAARQPGLTIVNDYYTHEGFREVTGKSAKVVTAIACFYDVDEVDLFLGGVHKTLARDGLLCLQVMDLKSMLDNVDVGNLTHEHVAHYSATTLVRTLQLHGFHVEDLTCNNVNGGSIRVYARKGEPHINSGAVHNALEFEAAQGLNGFRAWDNFRGRLQEQRQRVRDFVLNPANQPVYVYGASTKMNLQLEVWGLGRGDLAGAADKDPRKWGLEMGGTRVPIVSEAAARARARSFLVGPYGFRKEFILREAEFLSRGGQMAFVMPTWEVVHG